MAGGAEAASPAASGLAVPRRPQFSDHAGVGPGRPARSPASLAASRIRVLPSLNSASTTLARVSAGVSAGRQIDSLGTRSGAVAGCPHVGALPSDIETLDRLSALSDERAEELVADDTIHPGMDRGALATRLQAEARESKERDLAARTEEANRELADRGLWRKYNVIYADPPWRFETYSAKGLRKAADNYYQTMTVGV